MGTDVTVQWKKHGEFLLKGIADFFVNEWLADTNVTHGNDRLRVHRLILAVFLPTFKRSLDVATEDPLMALNFDSVADSGEDVRALIQFIYTGTLTVPESRLKHMRQLAEDLCFQGLAEILSADDDHRVHRPASSDVKCESTNDHVIGVHDRNVDDDKPHPESIGVDICDVKTESPADLTTQDWILEPDTENYVSPLNDNFLGNAQLEEVSTVGNNETVARRKAADTSRYRRHPLLDTSEPIAEDSSPDILRCEPCDIQFDSQMDLKIHFRCSHPNDKLHACRIKCGFLTVCESELFGHMMSRHPPPTSQKFKCARCSATFTKRHFLMHHVLTVHENVRPYKCPQCMNKSFKSHSSLKLHAIKKHGSAVAKDRHRLHDLPSGAVAVASIHEMFWCDECDAGFENQTGLARHVLAVHDESTPTSVEVEVCMNSDTTANRDEPTVADNRVARRRPATTMHDCDRCSRTFKSAFTLKLHVRSKHGKSGEQLHKCDVCDNYYSIAYLAKHMSRIHKVKLGTTMGERMGLNVTPRRTKPAGPRPPTDQIDSIDNDEDGAKKLPRPGRNSSP